MPLQLVYGDNHIRLLDERDEVARCPFCQVPTHPFDHGFHSKEVPPTWDLSGCFEGFSLASPRLKQFLDANCTSPVTYFETGGGYFVLRPEWSVHEDFGPTELSYSEPCECCGRQNSCVGIPVGILAGQRDVGAFDLVRSAIERGSGSGKSFSLIVGEGLASSMRAANFSGVEYVGYDRDEHVARLVLYTAGKLRKQREFVRSAQMYQDFLDDFSCGVSDTADRNYLTAYARYHIFHVGRKIGRKYYSEVAKHELQELANNASIGWQAWLMSVEDRAKHAD